MGCDGPWKQQSIWRNPCDADRRSDVRRHLWHHPNCRSAARKRRAAWIHPVVHDGGHDAVSSVDDHAAKAVKPKLLALFIVICTVGIIIVGYFFNMIQGFIL